MKPDDLSTLEVLDENTIVHALRGRFQQDDYYVSFVFNSNLIQNSNQFTLLVY